MEKQGLSKKIVDQEKKLEECKKSKETLQQELNNLKNSTEQKVSQLVQGYETQLHKNNQDKCQSDQRAKEAESYATKMEEVFYSNKVLKLFNFVFIFYFLLFILVLVLVLVLVFVIVFVF